MMHVNGADPSVLGQPSLMCTIQEFYAGMADFDAQTFGNENERMDAYAAKSFKPPLAKLEAWNTAAESHDAALEALRLVRKEAEVFAECDLTVPLLSAAIAFFEKQGGAA